MSKPSVRGTARRRERMSPLAERSAKSKTSFRKVPVVCARARESKVCLEIGQRRDCDLFKFRTSSGIYTRTIGKWPLASIFYFIGIRTHWPTPAKRDFFGFVLRFVRFFFFLVGCPSSCFFAHNEKEL